MDLVLLFSQTMEKISIYFDLFSCLQCIAEPIHCLIQSFTLCCWCFKYLECSIFESVQTQLSMHLQLYKNNIHLLLHWHSTWNSWLIDYSNGFFITSAKLIHPCISCLLANTTKIAPASSSSCNNNKYNKETITINKLLIGTNRTISALTLSMYKSSSLEMPIRSRSAESTT